MEPEIDLPAGIAALLFLGIVGGSIYLWVQQTQQPSEEPSVPQRDLVWPIGWINFGIFFCALIVAVVVVQTIGAQLLLKEAPEGGRVLTPELAIFSILTLQLPILGVYYALRKLMPEEFGGDLNVRVLEFRPAFSQGFRGFLMFMPIIWVASMIWNAFLNALQRSGYIEPPVPQELVSLLAEGGNPILIALLALFAVVLAPIVEETIFRGCIYRFLKTQMPMFGAQILSGAFFALMHGNLMSFVPLVAVGVILAHVYEKSGSILVPIIFHACFNAFSLTLLYLASQSSVMPT